MHSPRLRTSESLSRKSRDRDAKDLLSGQRIVRQRLRQAACWGSNSLGVLQAETMKGTVKRNV